MRHFVSLILLIACLTPSLPVRADEDSDRLIMSLCENTKINDRSNLRKKIKAADLQLRRIYGGISCDGMSMLRFSVANSAGEAAEFIVSQVGKDALTDPEKDGKSVVQYASNDPAKKAMVDALSAQ